jgi:hypothetical protein
MCSSSLRLNQMDTDPIICLVHAFILGDSTFDQQRKVRLDLIADFEQELDDILERISRTKGPGLPVSTVALIDVTLNLQSEISRLTELEAELSLFKALIESLK